MIPSHWGIDRLPFSGPFDPHCFHQGPAHEEALARLHFLVDQGCRLGLLLGGSGTGKSWLLQIFHRALIGSGLQAACVPLAGIDAREMLWQVGVQLGTSPTLGESLSRLWRRLSDRIVENRLLERATVILLDDADEAADEVLSHVVRLAECGRSGAARVTLALSANCHRVKRLRPRLAELASLRIDLHPWPEAETVAHLESILARHAGRLPAFSPEAVSRLHELARGVPRCVNRLADLALLASAGGEPDPVDPATVASVFDELSVRPADVPALA